MSVTAPIVPASVPMVLAKVDDAKARSGFKKGALALLATPDPAAQTDVHHDGQLVSIRTATSALAVRELLRERPEDGWLVILTDRTDQDLGAGILARLVWHRVRRPDPWEAVQQRFAAQGIAPALTSLPAGREVAAALLAAAPAEGWPAAPAGQLTRAHALRCVARTHLGVDGPVIDAITVLGWSARASTVGRIAELRRDHGDPLVDATLDWLAESTGAAAPIVRQLLADGAVADLVPLGVVVGLIDEIGPGTLGGAASGAGEVAGSASRGSADGAVEIARLALVRLESRLGRPLPTREARAAFGVAAAAVLAELAADEHNDAHVTRIHARADQLLEDLDASPLAIGSDLLQHGYRMRLMALAGALRDAVAELSGPAAAAATAAVEAAWARVQRHTLSTRSWPEQVSFAAAVRLLRWLRTPELDRATFDEIACYHVEHGGWADSAVNDAYTGVDDPELASALHAVCDKALERRIRENRAFAAQLARHTASADGASSAQQPAADAGPVWRIESVLPALVVPMARTTPVLFVVLDGMSAATAVEIVTDLTDRHGWVEAGTTQAAQRRAAAVSVLPSVTETSRTSLLCGRLEQGGQDVERTGYSELTGRAGKIQALLFHKKALDTTSAGARLADGVSEAIADPQVQLVTVVLNTVDGSLDRSDPAGVAWDVDAVKHLRPILTRARSAGRTVVLSADHGHVVERRAGAQRKVGTATSARSRIGTAAGAAEPARADEIEVHGPRVLAEGGRCVLAVDEGLRYTGLKAGYHGGGSAQEVVVPVVVLLPDDETNPLKLPFLPPSQPDWWLGPQSNVADDPTAIGSAAGDGLSGASGMLPGRVDAAPTDRSTTARPPEPTLFDAPTAPAGPKPASLGGQVVASSTYRAQRDSFGRLALKDEQVVAAIDALGAAAGRRLPRVALAGVLAVPPFQLDGAVSQLRQALNVEGYPVVGVDPDGQTVVLDISLLREQFEVPE